MKKHSIKDPWACPQELINMGLFYWTSVDDILTQCFGTMNFAVVNNGTADSCTNGLIGNVVVTTALTFGTGLGDVLR